MRSVLLRVESDMSAGSDMLASSTRTLCLYTLADVSLEG